MDFGAIWDAYDTADEPEEIQDFYRKLSGSYRDFLQEQLEKLESISKREEVKLSPSLQMQLIQTQVNITRELYKYYTE